MASICEALCVCARASATERSHSRGSVSRAPPTPSTWLAAAPVATTCPSSASTTSTLVDCVEQSTPATCGIGPSLQRCSGSRNYWPVAIRPEALAFGARAEDYEKGRPDYPPSAIRWLIERLAVGNGSTILDLAAGTGKLTRALVPSGARVVAVEPVAGMRDTLRSVVPSVEVLEGTAEQLPVPDGFADAVTVGQAFHWFRGEEALAEIHRALVPGGRLGLIWNVRDLDQPVQAELSGVIERYRGSTPSQDGGVWKSPSAIPSCSAL